MTEKETTKALVPKQDDFQVVEVTRDPFNGMSMNPVSDQESEVLRSPVEPDDIEIRPDGIVYLPEIKYRRVLNNAFGPMGWALMPHGKPQIDKISNIVYWQISLHIGGAFASVAIGEQEFYISDSGRPNMTFATAAESAKSNAMMRCCKDLGVASELWDKAYIVKWQELNAAHVWCEGVAPKIKGKKKLLWRRNDRAAFDYPWREDGAAKKKDVVVEKTVVVKAAPKANPKPKAVAPAKAKSIQQPEEEAPAAVTQPAPARQEETKYKVDPTDTRKISDKQRKFLFVISRNSGWKEEEVKEYIKETFGYEHRTDIQRKDFSEIIEFVKSVNPENLREKSNDGSGNANKAQAKVHEAQAQVETDTEAEAREFGGEQGDY